MLRLVYVIKVNPNFAYIKAKFQVDLSAPPLARPGFKF